MAENSMIDLKNYFSTKEKPCTLTELRELWNDLTEDEKQEFRSADLS